jgi:hypothetical protein
MIIYSFPVSFNNYGIILICEYLESSYFQGVRQTGLISGNWQYWKLIQISCLSIVSYRLSKFRMLFSIFS